MKLQKNIIRLVCRKDKKALKNHPCKKTKRGRFIIEVLNTSYDCGSFGIGYQDGCEILQYSKGYEHPKGHFYSALIKGTSPWRYSEGKYPQESIIDEDLFDL